MAAVSRPPCFEPNGSKAEDFGLDTEPTSATRRNQMKFQLSPAPAALPHSRKKLQSRGVAVASGPPCSFLRAYGSKNGGPEATATVSRQLFEE